MSARNAPLTVGGEPRVQLLPPMVLQRAKLRQTRRLLVLLIVLALVVVAGGTAFGLSRSLAAQVALAAAQERTQQILAEQAQYADGARVAGLVSVSEDAQLLITSGEIDWTVMLSELVAYLPAGAGIDSTAFTAPAPWEPALVPEGPLRAPRVATMSITVASGSYADAAAFAAAVVAHPAVADVTITTSTFEDGRYLTVVALTLDADALALRFEDDEGDSGDDEEAEEEAPEPTPTPTPTPTETEGVTP